MYKNEIINSILIYLFKYMLVIYHICFASHKNVYFYIKKIEIN